ncbi:MAG: 3-dehydroquinate synthase family protein [Bacteroidales bacterium]|jgi:3-dehydroquinate synthase|nr:3-dehydroquinate synthase family protein [Bacteroidales bacterium]
MQKVEIVSDLKDCENDFRLASEERAIVLCDSNTAKHCLPHAIDAFPQLSAYPLLVIPAGEESKSFDSVQYILKHLLAAGAGRESLLITIGGGMITDLGGFAASIYKRGLRCIHIPTSLLAMVDASVGGKTGIDFNGIKNSVGSFYFPEKSIIWTGFLNSLPQRQIRCGLAEMLKHSIIAGGETYESFLNQNQTLLLSTDAIAESIRIKNEFVLIDPYDKGQRMALNLGHSIGHALEAWSNAGEKNPLYHGESVAAGLIAELFLSVRMKSFPEYELERITKWIINHNIIPKLQITEANQLIQYATHDKKNRRGKITMSLMSSPGHVVTGCSIHEEEFLQAIRYVVKILQSND